MLYENQLKYLLMYPNRGNKKETHDYFKSKISQLLDFNQQEATSSPYSGGSN